MTLQPDSADIYERVVEQSRLQRWATLRAAVPAIRTGKRISPSPAVLPFLVFEDGLGMLTPYVANVYELLDGRGRAWMRKRGTYEAIERGLAFLGLVATTEPADHRRRWWNSAQLRFPALPANDNPVLERIDGIMRLSLPFRSDFRRGVHQYDVGPLIGNASRLNRSMLERESGTRLKADGPLWSFGRTTEIEHILTEAEGVAIGNWIDVPAEESLAWVDMDYPWLTADFAWADDAQTQRRALMASWFAGRTVYLRITDADDAVIGYRRCFCRPVSPVFAGPYSFGSQSFTPSTNAQQVYIEAMTQFGDADGVSAASVALMANVTLAAGVKPGRLWLQPDEITAGTAFAETAVSLPLRTTVRERFKIMMRF